MASGECVPAPVRELPQPPASLRNHLGRQVPRETRRPRPGARRVAEHVVVGERHLFQTVAGPLKRVLRFAREPDNHVGPQAESGNHLHCPIRKLAIVPHGVAAAHSGEHLVVPALHREMEVTAQGAALGHPLEQAVLHGGGLDRGDPDPLDPRNFLEPVRNVGERASSAPVPPDVHAGEHQLLVAGHGEVLGLPDQVGEPPAALPAPRVGNDAERTEEVAAVLHLEIGAGGVITPGGRDLELMPGNPRRVENHGFREFPRSIEVVGKGLLELGPDDHVHPGDFPECVQTGLRVTPRHHHKGFGRVAQGPPHGVAAVSLRAVGHRAGVDHHEIGRIPPGNDRVAFARELPCPVRRLRVVETTTQRCKRCPWHGREFNQPSTGPGGEGR